jgi:hypothetical protein
VHALVDVVAGRLHRRRSGTDDFRGLVYFADVRDKDIERHNLSGWASVI